MNTPRTRRQRPRTRAFTLVELVVALAVMAIIMTGLGSAVLIASHALPDDQNRATAITDAAAVADQIVEELRSALWIRQRSGKMIFFSVPDRDGDGNSERIRYSWSGNAGDSLLRQYNGGSPVAVLENVQDFALDFDIVSVSEEYPGAPVESAEQVLSYYGGSDDLRGFSISASSWIGQYFKPALPAEAISWRVTRVFFEARDRGASDGQTYVQLRPAKADSRPSDTVLEQHIMYETDIVGGYGWREFSFSNVSGIAPDQGLCLVLQFRSADVHSAKVRYAEASAGRLTTFNAGSSWNVASERVMRHYIYGTYSTPGSPQTATRNYFTGIGLRLRSAADSSGAVVTRAQTLNSPELLDGWWQTDFDSDPTADYNGDGTGDWAVYGGGAFGGGSLSDGVWQSNATLLYTVPDNDFAKLTIAEVRFRDPDTAGSGAVFWINVDWADLTAGPILAYLQRQADQTQTLTVYRKPSGAVTEALVTVPGLSGEFVSLRLLIDPELDTVNVRVEGTDYGTYHYTRYALPASQRTAIIGPAGGKAEFDYVSVRVSE